MSRSRPGRTSAWKRLLNLLSTTPAPRRRPRQSWVDDLESRPRPDLLQSLGGRVD